MSNERFLEAGISNPLLIEEMYERYSQDCSSVDASWQRYFQELEGIADTPSSASTPLRSTAAPVSTPTVSSPSAAATTAASSVAVASALHINQLLRAYRTYGHLVANINPILTQAPAPEAALSLESSGLSEAQLDQTFPTNGLLNEREAPLRVIVDTLKEIYCGTVGVEYMSLGRPDIEAWIQQRVEASRFKGNLSIEQKQAILQNLNKSELFEVFLHTKYVGQKRFSLEGGETLIPMLSGLIESGAEHGVTDFNIGMAHRGRLNVLANILNKSYGELFSEFEEHYMPDSFEGSGDVKYHKGFSAELPTASGKDVKVFLAANPSHLEAVYPVVEGVVRAKQVKIGDDVEMKQVLPIVIHGDAAVSGQGVIYETMQFQNLAGYGTGGTIHIVVNNQIGFTTLPKDSRSTRYCSDIARSFSAPVFHVNAEDAECCVYVTNLAMELRQRFRCDVYIELNCYRKFGHNESDEPAFTQPLEYKLIRKKVPIRELYRNSLIQEGVLEKYVAESLESEFKEALQTALKRSYTPDTPQEIVEHVQQERVRMLAAEQEFFQPANTSVEAELLKELADRFCSVPEDFNSHRKLDRLLKERIKMVNDEPDKKVIDWGMAEHLAFASLLWEGTHVRLSGQDSRRGTFSHRHAMWMDQVKEKKVFPLNQLKEGQGRFDVFNSPLSEYGVLGFEFGYSTAYTNALVMWEAQFGDFCNGAQIIIDQFISTAEQKWGRTCNLVMLLPHGYEGQGPEHSSARMERFLQLAGDYNMQIVNATTPAQFFHLLRRQVHRPLVKPLVVFTPKGLLRHQDCVSSMNELSTGGFEEVLPDVEASTTVKRVILCSGRVYYDLLEQRRALKNTNTAIVRVEQLYPLHKVKLKKLLDQYRQAEEFLWVQEEPSNMGAWNFMRPRVRRLLPGGKELIYVGRERSASPAAGSAVLHKRERTQLLSAAFLEEGKKLYELSYEHGVRI